MSDGPHVIICRTSVGVPKGYVVFLRRILGAQTDIVVGVHRLSDVSSGVVVTPNDVSSVHYSAHDFTVDQLMQMAEGLKA